MNLCRLNLHRRLLPLVVCCFLGLIPLSARAAQHKLLIITNVNIVDVRTGEIAKNRAVLIRDGRIDAIGKVALIGRSKGMQVVNASGKYLIPGLWDMHVHSAGGSGPAWDENLIYPLYVASGITGIRDMGGDPALLHERKAKIQRGDLVGPEILYVGPFLQTRKGDATAVQASSPEEGRQAVADLKKQGVDFVKVLSDFPPATYFAIADECRKQGMRLVGHVPDGVNAGEAAAAGQNSIEHLSGIFMASSSREEELRKQLLDAIANRNGPGYSAANRAAENSFDPKKAAALFAVFREKGTWQVPTLVWWRAQTQFADLKLGEQPELRFVPASARKDWNPEDMLKQISPATLAGFKTMLPRYLETVNVMRHAQVAILAGTDGPDPFVIPGFSLHEELKLLLEAGMTPLEVLQSATLRSAEILGRADSGSIERKYVADLVLLEKNPLQDIANTSKIAGVVLRGRYFSRQDLDKMLSQVEALAKTE